MKKDCFVRKADTFEVLMDGKSADIQANKANMGEEFDVRMIPGPLVLYKLVW